MKKALRKEVTKKCWHFVDGKKVFGVPSCIFGDVSGIRGDVSGIRGNVSGLCGDVDET
jgi:hypothetical protein